MANGRNVLQEKWMRTAIELASEGAGRTHPNPAVGAVVVKDGRIVGKGYHEGPGKPHAEVIALKEAGSLANGADLYVTLEPCPTYGKTPPCTDAIIGSGIKRVIAGARDPNPKVSGRGCSLLKKNGIEVVERFLEKEAVRADIAYHTFYRKKRPYINLKWAQSIDGVTANPGGGYITGKKARERVHEERFLSDAILVTSGTIKRDEPRLTIRDSKKKKPVLRVVLDRHGLKRLPERFLSTAPRLGEIWIMRSRSIKAPLIEGGGVKTMLFDCGPDLSNLIPEVLRFLRSRQVLSLYVEAVGELATFLIRKEWVDRLSVDIAPLILGRGGSPSPVSLPLKNPLNLKRCEGELAGPDIIYCIDLEGKCLRG